MKKIFIFFILLFPFFSFSEFKEKKTSPDFHPLWSVKTETPLKPRLTTHISPALAGDLVIQGNGWAGIKALKRKNGRLVWSRQINGGVSSPVEAFDGKVFFGAGDGFFYSLDSATGKMIWRFFTGSENIGAPVIDGKRVYFMSAGQKIYALSLKTGQAVWLYSGPFLSLDMFVRGTGRPALSRQTLYVGFYDGSLMALNKKNGKRRWRTALKGNVSRAMGVSGRCLLVPVFNKGVFCLSKTTGKIRWKAPGGAVDPVIRKGKLYQGDSQRLYSLEKFNGKIHWKTDQTYGVALTPAFYKNTLLYGSPSDGQIHAVSLGTGERMSSFYFGRGLSAPVTVDQKSGEIYFFSIDGYVHKARLEF